MRFVRPSLLAMVTLGTLALPVAGTAQVSLGLNAGVSSANFSVDNIDYTDARTGLRAGAYLAFPLSDFFSIAPGAYYVKKGAGVRYPLAGDVSMVGSLDLAYLEVPLLGVFNITGADRSVGVSLFLGPSVAFEVSCNNESGLVLGSEDEPEEPFLGECDGVEGDELDEREKTVDVSAIFGAGLSFPLSGSVALTLNGGLDMGLTPIDQPGFVELLRSLEEEAITSEEAEGRNTTWFVTGGLRFLLGG